jgi:methylglyoxal synthase
MIQNKTIALIAHDRRKADMVEWVKYNAHKLLNNELVCTGTTGQLIDDTLEDYIAYYELNNIFPRIDKKSSGPMGGDAEIAAMVVNGQIDFCVFLIDDLNPNPHEADIQMLLRQCRVHNVPVACNRSTADFIISSDLWDSDYKATKPIYKEYERNL